MAGGPAPTTAPAAVPLSCSAGHSLSAPSAMQPQRMATVPDALSDGLASRGSAGPHQGHLRMCDSVCLSRPSAMKPGISTISFLGGLQEMAAEDAARNPSGWVHETCKSGEASEASEATSAVTQAGEGSAWRYVISAAGTGTHRTCTFIGRIARMNHQRGNTYSYRNNT